MESINAKLRDEVWDPGSFHTLRAAQVLTYKGIHSHGSPCYRPLKAVLPVEHIATLEAIT